MATLHLTGNTTVTELKKEFNAEFGSQIRVYNGRSQAKSEDKLSDLDLTTSGDFECHSSLTVASFIERMQKEYGLKVKVYTCDEWVAVLDGLTLESSGKVKKNANKADMESMITYQRYNTAVPFHSRAVRTQPKQNILLNDTISCSDANSSNNESPLSLILTIFNELEHENKYIAENGFSDDKESIRYLFKQTEQEGIIDILLRLTVIDSMYSTQMTRRYYGLSELSNALYTVKSNSKSKSMSALFLSYLKNRNIEPFVYFSKEENAQTNLFSEKYGIGKDGNDKGIALSLISKYAYFDTKEVFPIYDSIACEMIPIIWKRCFFSGNCPSLSENSKKTGEEKLNDFLDAHSKFKKNLGIKVSNDHIDRLLWYVGKIYRGNLSLVLCRKDYKWCSDNGYIIKENDETRFHIEDVDIDKLPFLINQPLLYKFFKLAKLLK